MAMGYCKKCKELVKIVEGPHIKEGFSAKFWWPVPHNKPDGSKCEGSEHKI